jgi:hypothetical protein
MVVGFCLAVAATFFFGYRAGRTARRVHWKNEPIQAWMTVPFVAHTHHTPPELLFTALHLQPDAHDRRSIREIAKDEKVPAAKLVHDLEDAIAAAHRSDSANVPPPGKAP